MMELLSMATGAVLTGIGATIGALIVKKGATRIKWTSPDMDYLKRALEKLEEAERRRAREIQLLFQLQKPQIKTNRAVLEAFRDGETNGSIEKVLKEVMESERALDQFFMDGIGC